MASAIKYLSNVSKSIKYASIDAFKELNPVLTEAVETNSDVMKATYNTIKNFKSISNKAYQSVRQSQIGELAAEAKKNLFEDIRNGTFYNRERINKADSELMDAFGSEFDAGGDLDFNPDEGGDNFGEFGMDDLADTVDKVGQKSSSAVSQVIARSAEYQVQASKQSTMKILAQQTAMTSMIHTDMAAVNTNLANILKFNTENMSTHITNSATFYSRQQEQMSEQTALLKELVDITKQHYAPTKQDKKSGRITASGIMDSSGNIDISQYFKYVKQNVKDNSTGMGDFLKTAMELGIGKEMVASPLQSAMTGAVKLMVPKVLKESMAQFNDTMGSVFSNAILGLTEKQGKGGLAGVLGKVLGLSDSDKYKQKYSTSNYNKGPAQWSGVDHKALTEVIPTYLAKIYSAISGEDELRYDYNSGKFIKARAIKKQWQKSIRQDARNAHGPLYDALKGALTGMDFGGDQKAQDQLLKDLDDIMQYNLKHARRFNPDGDRLSAKQYGLSGGEASEYNLELIKQVTKSLENSEQLLMKQAKSMLDVVETRRSQMEREEEAGHSVFNALHDDSLTSERNKGKKSPAFKLSTQEYLYNINKEIAFIRTLLSSRGTGSGLPIVGQSNDVPSFDSFKFYGDTKTETKKKSSTTTTASRAADKENAFKYGESATGYGRKPEEKESLGEEKLKDTFLDKMIEAKTFNEKFKVILGGVDDLSKAPAKFLAGIMDKADHRIYKMLFGSGNSNEESGLMSKVTESLNKWLDEASTNAKNRFDTFKETLKKKFSKENIKTVANKLFQALGIDTEAMNKSAAEYFFGEGETSFFGGVKNMFKKGFSNMWGGIKNAFKDVWGGIKGNKDLVLGTKNSLGLAKEKRNKMTTDLLNFAGMIESAATGMRRVKRTGLVAVSEGEMIVPPDQNPHNIRKRRYNEQLAIKRYNKYFGSDDNIPSFAEGGEVDGEYDGPKATTILKHINDEEWLINNIPFKDSKQFNAMMAHLNTTKTGKKVVARLKKKAAEWKTRKKEKYTRDDYQAGQERLDMRMIDQAKATGSDWLKAFQQTSAYDSIEGAIKGVKDKNMSESFKEAKKDVFANIKDYLPDMAAGGLTGAVLSGVFGLIGGPLLGAAAGTSIALIKNSEKVQKFLFGEEVTDEEGNTSRTGGLLSKELSTNINKYFPDMAKGGIVGGITSILPFVPGGPITGVLLGSAIGFAKNNEKIKNALFGEDKILGKMKEKVQQMLPKMGLGAAAGLMFGPFGLTTNIMVGAALGMASDTNKFKDIVFGREGFDKKRHGGIVGFIHKRLLGIKELADYTIEKTKNWFEKSIKRPLKDFMAPMKQQGKLLLRWFKDAIFNTFRDSVGKPIGWAVDKFLKPFEKMGKGVFKMAAATVRGTVGLPFRALGGIGRSVRRHQLANGTAYDLTAEERLDERKRLFGSKVRARRLLYDNEGQSRLGKTLNKLSGGKLASQGKHNFERWNGADKIMANMDAKQARELADVVGVASTDKKTFIKKAKSSYTKDPQQRLMSHVSGGQLDHKVYTKVVKAMNAGRPDTVRLLLKASSLPDNAKKEAIKQCVKAAQNMRDALEKADRQEEVKNNVMEELRKAGFNDVDPKNKKAMRNLEAMLRTEANAKAPQEEEHEELEKQKKTPQYQLLENNHKELMFRLQEIIKVLEDPPEKRFEGQEINANTVYGAIQAGDYEGVKYLLKNGTFGPGVASKLMDSANAKMKEVYGEKHAPTFTTDSFGRILKTKKDSQGNMQIDNSDSETNDVIKQQEKEKKSQNGIVGRISGLTDTIKGIFGKKDDEEDDGGGFFSKIFKSGISGAASGLVGVLGKTAPWLLGALGLTALAGISQKTVKVKKKDANGNVMTDMYGNPIMEDKKLLDIVTEAGSKIWMGEDGTGNTSGIWFHIKDFTTNQLLPTLTTGFDFIVSEGIPWLVSKLISSLPNILGGVVTGIVAGIKNLIPFLRGDDDDAPTAEASSANIEGNYSVTSGGSILNGVTVSGVSNAIPRLTYTSSNGKTSVKNAVTNTISTTFKAQDSGTPTSSSSSASGNSATNSTIITTTGTSTNSSSSTANTEISKKTQKKMNKSAAFKNTNENVRRKADDQLAGLWDQPTALGMTVGEVLNSPDLVLGSIVNTDTGEEIEITGANVLQHPVAAQQFLGIDVSLTDKERSDYTKELGLRSHHETNFGTRVLTDGMFHTYMRGGTKIANQKFLKVLDKGTKIPGKIIKKVPVIGRPLKYGMDVALNAPVKAVRGFSDVVANSRELGSFSKGVKASVTNAKNARKAKKAAEAAKKAAKKQARADKFNKFKNFFSKKSAETTADVTTKYMNKATNTAAAKIAKMDAAPKVKGIASKSDNFATAVAKRADEAAKVAGKVDDVAEAGAKVAGKVDDVAKAGAKSSGVVSKVTGKISSKVTKVAEKAGKVASNSKIGQFLKKAGTCIKGFFKNSKVLGFLSKITNSKVGTKTITKVLEAASEKLIKESGKKIVGKVAGKILGKLASFISSGGTLLIIDAVASFVMGMYKADIFLKIKKPSLLQKVLMGIVHALNNVFLLGIWDTGDMFDFFYENVAKKICPDLKNSSLEKERKELQNEVDKYNKENGTNLSTEEYLKKDKILYKVGGAIKSGAKKVWGGIKSFFGFGGDDDEKKEESSGEASASESSGGEEAQYTSASESIQNSEVTETANQYYSDSSGYAVNTDTTINEQQSQPQSIDQTSQATGSTNNGTGKKKSLFQKAFALTPIGMAMNMGKAISAKMQQSSGMGQFKVFATLLRYVKEIRDYLLPESARSDGIGTRLIGHAMGDHNRSGIGGLISKALSLTPIGMAMKAGATAGKLIKSKLKPNKEGDNNVNSQFTLPSSLFTEENRTLFNTSMTDINSAMPSMIEAFKVRLINLFGLSEYTSEGNTQTPGSSVVMDETGKVIQSTRAVKSSRAGARREKAPSNIDLKAVAQRALTRLSNSPSDQFISKMENVWKTAEEGTASYRDTLPAGIDASEKMLAVNLGLADHTDQNIDLRKMLNSKDYLQRRTEIVQNNSPISRMLGGVTESNTVDAAEQEAKLKDFSNDIDNHSNSLGSIASRAVKTFFSMVGGGLFGKGSGIGNSEPKQMGDDHVKPFFVSQKYGKYANKTFKAPGDALRYKIKDAGCAPAAAAIAINNNWGSDSHITMDEAIKHAQAYALPGGEGITADYFAEEFANHGFRTAYVSGNSSKKKDAIIRQLRRGNTVVLVGQDEKNKSKKKSPFGPESHYVVADGISANGRTIYISDPEAKEGHIAYDIDTIMKATNLGIVPIKSNQKISATVNSKVKAALKKFSGKDTEEGSEEQEYKVSNRVIYIGGEIVELLESHITNKKKMKFIYAYNKKTIDWYSAPLTYSIFTKTLLPKLKKVLSQEKWKKAHVVFFADQVPPKSRKKFRQALKEILDDNGHDSGLEWVCPCRQAKEIVSISASPAPDNQKTTTTKNDTSTSSNNNGDTDGNGIITRAEATKYANNKYTEENGGTVQDDNDNYISRTEAVKQYNEQKSNTVSSQEAHDNKDDTFNGRLKEMFGDHYLGTNAYINNELGLEYKPLREWTGKQLRKLNKFIKRKLGEYEAGYLKSLKEDYSINTLLDAYNIFDDLAKSFGIYDSSSSDTTKQEENKNKDTSNQDDDTSDITGNTSSDSFTANLQKRLVKQMKSVEGKLSYTQAQSLRNKIEDGYGDCSSTVAWAYRKVLDGVDIGACTSAQRTNDNLYTVSTKVDESKMQLGDLLYKQNPGHVEMYIGNGKMMGHGGGADGKLPGTNISDLNTTSYDLVRRYSGFKGKGSGIETPFVSQTSSSYKNMSFGDETVGEAGCAPAVATMLSRGTTTMSSAIRSAVPYKSIGGGVTADYFADQFEKQGMNTVIFSGKNKVEGIKKALNGRNPNVVLLGQNPNNTSKSRSPFGPNSHYVLATGISEDGKYIYINDPELKTGNVRYSIDEVLPYTTVGIAGVPKKLNNALDRMNAKLRKALKKLSGLGKKYSKDSAEYKVWHGLRNAGYSEIATAACMGNIYGESGFNPTALEVGGGGFGLIQWTGGRRDKIVAYAKKKGVDVNNMDLQVEYLLLELDPKSDRCAWVSKSSSDYGVGPYSRDDWMNSDSIRTSTEAFCCGFERPAVWAFKSSIDKRTTAAEGYYEAFTGQAIDSNALNGGDSDTENKGTNPGSTEELDTSSISGIYDIFSTLANAYGFSNEGGNYDIGDYDSGDNGSKSEKSFGDLVGGSEYPKYELTKKQRKLAAGIITRETGGVDLVAARQEASQMVNLNDARYGKEPTGDNLNDTLLSGWYANADKSHKATKIAYQAVDEVIKGGKRVLPRYVVEHDMFPTDAARKKDLGAKNPNRNKYVAGKTKIHQDPSRFKNPATYTFYDFFGKNRDGDVSGYYKKSNEYKTYIDDIPWEGSGSGLLSKLNRFKENPTPIRGFKLSGRGTETPSYSQSARSNRVLSTPNLNSGYSNGSNAQVVVERQRIVQQDNSSVNQLINIVVKLLSQVVDNTSSIKDIAALLVKLIDTSSVTTTNNSNAAISDAKTKALILKALADSTKATNDSTLQNLISSVEAIAAQ